MKGSTFCFRWNSSLDRTSKGGRVFRRKGRKKKGKQSSDGRSHKKKENRKKWVLFPRVDLHVTETSQQFLRGARCFAASTSDPSELSRSHTRRDSSTAAHPGALYRTLARIVPRSDHLTPCFYRDPKNSRQYTCFSTRYFLHSGFAEVWRRLSQLSQRAGRVTPSSSQSHIGTSNHLHSYTPTEIF